MLDLERDRNYVVLGENLDVVTQLDDGSFQLIYLDPPFNTGHHQERKTLLSRHAADGERVGFGGRRYTSVVTDTKSYPDAFADYGSFIGPRLAEARRLLSDDGTLYVHLDYREAHYIKVLLDELFGRRCFLNELIWAYDFGGRSRRRWPAKHDTILVYVKDPDRYHFDQDAVDKIPYLAPGLVSPEKVARGKMPTDVWWHTIVATNGREKTGYPTQKPEAIVRRIVQASSAPGSSVLDFFAGSGTTGAVASALGRRFVLVDHNPQAVATMRRRLGDEAVYLRVDGAPLAAADGS